MLPLKEMLVYSGKMFSRPISRYDFKRAQLAGRGACAAVALVVAVTWLSFESAQEMEFALAHQNIP